MEKAVVLEKTEPRVEESAEAGSAADAALERAERREAAALDALRALLRDHYLHRFGGRDLADEPLTVTLDLRAEPANAWELRFDPSVEEQLERQLSEHQAGRGRYQRGRVYCFRCRAGDCAHAFPPSPLAVFKGYTATGQPDWHELAQALVAEHDDRVDRLFETPPSVLAVVQMGRELKSLQLSSFGKASKTYAVLGQVIAGYLRLPPREAERAGAPERVAVTLQAAESRDEQGRIRISLNPLTGMPLDLWDELLVSAWRSSVGGPVEEAARGLEDIERRVRAARETARAADARKAFGGIPRILHRLAAGLERGGRRGARRTRHAETRRGERPVHKALEDARSAGDDELFYDLKRNTFVACGRQGRAHVFNAAGKHVTSFVLPPGGADFRLRTERWRKLDPAELAGFRELMERPVSGSAEERGGDDEHATGRGTDPKTAG